MNKPATYLLVALCAAAPGARLLAADDARQIIATAQQRTESQSQEYEGLLQSFSGNGKVAEKRWTFRRIGAHGRSKSVIRFTAPAEVKGVALLIVNHPDKSSDQWMWTPALERDRRIALQDRSTRFFGTDFSFEDLEERDVDQYDYALLGEEPIDGVPSWQIETTPKQAKSSQYTRSIVWVRKDNYATARIDLFVKDQVVRRLVYSDIRQVHGIWTAHDTTVYDVKRNTHTRLQLERVAYDVKVQDDDFTLPALRR